MKTHRKKDSDSNAANSTLFLVFAEKIRYLTNISLFTEHLNTAETRNNMISLKNQKYLVLVTLLKGRILENVATHSERLDLP